MASASARAALATSARCGVAPPADSRVARDSAWEVISGFAALIGGRLRMPRGAAGREILPAGEISCHIPDTSLADIDASLDVAFRREDVRMNSPNQNQLLCLLDGEEFARISPHLELVPLALGQVIYEAGARLQHVYFPTTAIVSLLYVTVNGSSAEIGIVGNEGILGIALFMGGESTPSRAVVQSAGYGYRLKDRFVVEEFNRGGVLMHLLLRYTQALITQMAQTAVCNRHHSVDQQLCRWLLMSLDRLPGPELRMTQELIANMLGVRREGVTEAAGRLQRAGLISYSRGHITVLDRRGLERRVCECYRVVKREFDRLLSDIKLGDPFRASGKEGRASPERRGSRRRAGATGQQPRPTG